MAGGMFEKALQAWDALFGTDELRAALEDERGEVALLLQQLSDARAENASLQRRLNLAYRILDERNGGTVRQQYGELDAWMDAAKDVL